MAIFEQMDLFHYIASNTQTPTATKKVKTKESQVPKKKKASHVFQNIQYLATTTSATLRNAIVRMRSKSLLGQTPYLLSTIISNRTGSTVPIRRVTRS